MLSRHEEAKSGAFIHDGEDERPALLHSVSVVEQTSKAKVFEMSGALRAHEFAVCALLAHGGQTFRRTNRCSFTSTQTNPSTTNYIQ